MKLLKIGPQDALDDLEPCFDGLIQFHCANTPGAPPWRLMKAQCWQESRFNPLAVSPTGPVGLFQFTKATWGDWSKPGEDRRDVFVATGAAVRYMVNLTDWAKRHSIAGEEVIRFALGAYNQGQGNVGKAMALAANQGADPAIWANVATMMVQVVGDKRAAEVINYVIAILVRWEKYEAEGVKS
jgi:membrane-bound lytic murein transglycosylase F